MYQVNKVDSLYKHNDFIKMIQVKNQMTLQQQRVFDTLLTTIQKTKTKQEIDQIINEGTLELEANLFMSILKENLKKIKLDRAIIKESLENMVDIKFSYDSRDSSSKKNVIGAFVLFQKAEIDFDNNKLYVVFGKDFRTENLLPSANYTYLSHKFLNKFSLPYARILYQYLKMLIGKNSKKPFRTDITMSVDYLKDQFGVTENKSYNRFNNFNQRCISPAVEEINLVSDMNLEYEKIKSGRSVSNIKFIFTIKDEYLGQKIDNKFDLVEDERDSNIIIDINSDMNTDSLFIEIDNFKTFKDKIIKKYLGKDLCQGPESFNSNTIISINSLGYLHNNFSNNDLSPEDAKIVWKWLFENQNKVGDFKSDLELYNEKLNKKIFYQVINNIRTKLTIIEVFRDDEGYRLRLKKDDDSSENEIVSSVMDEQNIEQLIKNLTK